MVESLIAIDQLRSTRLCQLIRIILKSIWLRGLRSLQISLGWRGLQKWRRLILVFEILLQHPFLFFSIGLGWVDFWRRNKFIAQLFNSIFIFIAVLFGLVLLTDKSGHGLSEVFAAFARQMTSTCLLSGGQYFVEFLAIHMGVLINHIQILFSICNFFCELSLLLTNDTKI